MSKFEWTPAVLQQALDLYYAGKTMRDIAEAIGCRSRNAVIGKIHREQHRRGLTLRGGMQPAPLKPRKNRSQPKRKVKMTLPDQIGFVLPALHVTEPAPDMGNLASIIDVTGCRWPVKDDPSFVGGVGFCNHDTDGKTYCPFHTQQSVAPYSQALIRRTTKQAMYFVRRAA